MSAGRCYAARAPQQGPPLIQHGTLVFQAHHVGWIVTGVFTIIATVTSGWLVNKHLQWYTTKREQRYIVRLLFMVPIYAIISFASYLFWNHSTPLLLIRDGYESTVLTAFFYLLLTYLSSDPDEQKSIFLKVGLSRHADGEARRKGEPERKWLFPLGFVKWKPEDGLYFLQLMKWGILQYCVIRPSTTLVAVILDYAGLYCESSWQPRWGHVYITVIVSISVTIAMYCLLQVYVPISQHLAPRKPLLKLFAVKAVVFLTFWQATFLSLLATFGVVKDTNYMTASDINIGIGALIETFEMMIFAFLHIRAFGFRTYRPLYYPFSQSPPPTHTPRLRSLGHAMDFRETFKEIWTGWVYVMDRMRGREPTSDKGARRTAYLEDVFGRARPAYGKTESAKRTLRGLVMKEKDPQVGRLEVEVVEQVDVDVEGERQWLGLGDDYGYGLGYARREKSVGLGDQIERELQRRGYDTELFGRVPVPSVANDNDNDTEPVPKRQRSWWRTIYHRVSNDSEAGRLTPASTKRKSRASRVSRDVNVRRSLLTETDYAFDDLPPPSMIRAYRSSHQSSGRRQSRGQSRKVLEPHAETLTPVAIYDPAISYRDQEHTQPRDPASPQSLPPDSVLGRIFPDSTEPATSTEPGHDSTQSIADTPSRQTTRSTPRASLMPTVPLTLSHVQESGVTHHERNVQAGTKNLSSAMSAQIVGSPLMYSQPASPVHVHASDAINGHITSSTPRPRNTHDHDSGPSSVQEISLLHSTSRSRPVSTPTSRPPGLRRTPAITNNPSTRLRRQSLPVSPRSPPAFTSSSPTTTTLHVSTLAPASRSSRRTSSPLESMVQHSVPSQPSSSYSRTSHRNRYSVDLGERNWSSSGGLRLDYAGGRLGAGAQSQRERRVDGVLRRGLVMPQPLKRPAGIPPERGVSRPMRAGGGRPLTMDGFVPSPGPQRPRS